MSRFAVASSLAAVAGLLVAIEAYTHAGLSLAFVAAAIAAAALPLGLVAIIRRATGTRRGLRLAIPGMVLGAVVAAPAVWLLSL